MFKLIENLIYGKYFINNYQFLEATREKEMDRIIKISEVCHLTGLSRATIYRYMKTGTFPLKVSIGNTAIGFSLKEVLDWIEACKAARNQDDG